MSPPTESHFAALVRAILYQQLAGAAARAIHGRLLAALGGEVTPKRLLSLSSQTLRAVGLSASKAASMQDLATKMLNGSVVLYPAALRGRSNDEIVATLTGGPGHRYVDGADVSHVSAAAPRRVAQRRSRGADSALTS